MSGCTFRSCRVSLQQMLLVRNDSALQTAHVAEAQLLCKITIDLLRGSTSRFIPTASTVMAYMYAYVNAKV
jgi:hypothetical protein